MTGAEGEAGQVVEWWQPKVGQRVRVRLNGECLFWAHANHVDDRLWEDGEIGTVVRLVPLEHNAGHGYEVDFDKPYPHPPGRVWPKLIGSTYAAAELEPLPAAEPPADASHDDQRKEG